MKRTSRMVTYVMIFIFCCSTFTVFAGENPLVANYEDVQKRFGNAMIMMVGNTNTCFKAKKVKIDSANEKVVPLYKDGNVYIPLKFVVESFDGTYSENRSNISITYNDKSIKATLDNKKISINGSDIELSAPIKVEKDYVVAPMDFVEKTMGKKVYWDFKVKVIIISDTENIVDMQNDFDITILNKAFVDTMFDIPEPDKIVEELVKNNPNKQHPRITFRPGDFDKLRQTVKEDEYAQVLYKVVKDTSDSLLNSTPPTVDKMARGRGATPQIKALALTYQITKDPIYAERLWKHIEPTLSSIYSGDWMLEVSHTIIGLSVAYDWLYDYWSENRRAQLRDSILYHLNYSNSIIKGGVWWTLPPVVHHNFVPVCTSGVVVGAIAIGDEADKELVGGLINTILNTQIRSMYTALLPDGAWGEGHWYWKFSLMPFTPMLSAMESALGTSYGMLNYPILEQAIMYYSKIASPVYGFNFADSGTYKMSTEQDYFYADKFNNEFLAGARKQLTKAGDWVNPEDLEWYRKDKVPADYLKAMETQSEDNYYRNIELATLRNGWYEEDDVNFIGLKASTAKFNHSHLDAGTFIVDSMGVRWTQELAMDNYSLPEYFGGNRFFYTRTNVSGHNTLIFNNDGMCQDPMLGQGKMINFVSRDDEAFAISDLSIPYGKYVTKFQRGIKLDQNKSIFTIQDEVELTKRGNFKWQAFIATDPIDWKGNSLPKTTIEIKNYGKTAILTHESGKKMAVEIVTDENLYFNTVFTIESAAPYETSFLADKQNQNTPYTRLVINFKNIKSARYAVKFVPMVDDKKVHDKIYGLDYLKNWK